MYTFDDFFSGKISLLIESRKDRDLFIDNCIQRNLKWRSGNVVKYSDDAIRPGHIFGCMKQDRYKLSRDGTQIEEYGNDRTRTFFARRKMPTLSISELIGTEENIDLSGFDITQCIQI